MQICQMVILQGLTHCIQDCNHKTVRFYDYELQLH